MNLVERAKNIITTPKSEWESVAKEEPNTQQILLAYVFPLSLIPAISTIIGSIIFSPFGFSFGFATGLGMAIVFVISIMIVVLLSAVLVDAFATSFGSQKNFGRSLQLVAYSITPALVIGVLFFIPILGWFLYVAGFCYGIYILYLGLGPINLTPEDKKLFYLIISIVVILFVFWILFWLLTLIIMGIIMAIFGFGMMGGLNY
jgi:hypothetical protein